IELLEIQNLEKGFVEIKTVVPRVAFNFPTNTFEISRQIHQNLQEQPGGLALARNPGATATMAASPGTNRALKNSPPLFLRGEDAGPKVRRGGSAWSTEAGLRSLQGLKTT